MAVKKYIEGYKFKTKDGKEAIIKKRENSNRILIYIKDTDEEFYVKSFQISENTIISSITSKHKYDIGTQHETNYGKIEIIGTVKNYNKRKIRFINTGYETIAYLSVIKSGGIKDLLAPTICGIACFGEGEARARTREYGIYHNMIGRCYDKNDKDYDIYGGAGVRVEERWLNYQNFANDIKKLEGYEKWLKDKSYSIDKDSLQQNAKCKIYSRDTCRFITQEEQCSDLKTPILSYLDGIFYKEFKGVKEACSFFNIPIDRIIYIIKGNGDSKVTYKGSVVSFERKYFTKNPHTKKIYQYDINGNLIKEWESAFVASRSLNLLTGGIYGSCNGRNKTCGGFIFKYKKLEKNEFKIPLSFTDKFIGYTGNHPIYGSFEVIGSDENIGSQTKFLLKFINTGTIKKYKKYYIMNLEIVDDAVRTIKKQKKYKNSIISKYLNKIYNTGKYNEFIVSKQINRFSFEIKFTNFNITERITSYLLESGYNPKIFKVEDGKGNIFYVTKKSEIAKILNLTSQHMQRFFNKGIDEYLDYKFSEIIQ